MYLFKYISHTSILYLYLNTFDEQVFVICNKILLDVFVPIWQRQYKNDSLTFFQSIKSTLEIRSDKTLLSIHTGIYLSM